MRQPHTSYGFTIVELLIVIVVIAILAAISVVAYNGIQERTLNTKTEQAVAEYRKLLISYATDKGSYPGGGTSACLGKVSDYPGGCYGGSANATFVTDLQTWLGNSSLPTPNTECLKMYSETCRRSAAFTVNSWPLDGTSHKYWLIYLLKGNANCTLSGLSGGTWSSPTSTPNQNGWTEQSNGTSLCRIALPDPKNL